MKRKKAKRESFLIENLEIGQATAEGNCVARHEGQVLFVKYAAPGDKADIEVTRSKKSYMEGRINNLLSPGPDRVDPHCEHFGVCGGCSWQHLDYKGQLQMKQQWVKDSLERIGGFKDYPFSGIIGAAKTEFYRNKLEYSFTDRAWLTTKELQSGIEFSPALGFHVPGAFDRVIDINKCWHQDELSNKIRLALKSFCLEHNLEFFNAKRQEGFLRNITIRNTRLGEWMIILSFKREDQDSIKLVMDFLSDEFPQVGSLLYVVNTKMNDTIYDLPVISYKGPDFITETMAGFNFRIQPKSFFQTNVEQAELLYAKALEMAALTGKEIVYDLYTGTGTIAIYASKSARKVVGIEYVEQAIEDAKVNAELNAIENCSFFAGDIKDMLNDEFVKREGFPDVIITDPPRAGMHEDVVKKLLELRAGKIVYVSCNPATQARDLKLMSEHYNIEAIQAVDMFPHTSHVENIALLHLKN